MSTSWYWVGGAALIAVIALFGDEPIREAPGGTLLLGGVHGALAAADASIGALRDVTAANNGSTGLLANDNDNISGAHGNGTTPLGYGQRG